MNDDTLSNTSAPVVDLHAAIMALPLNIGDRGNFKGLLVTYVAQQGGISSIQTPHGSVIDLGCIILWQHWKPLTEIEALKFDELVIDAASQAPAPSPAARIGKPYALQELLGTYWEIAYSEGATGVSRGTEAQSVLSAITRLASQS